MMPLILRCQNLNQGEKHKNLSIETIKITDYNK